MPLIFFDPTSCGKVDRHYVSARAVWNADPVHLLNYPGAHLVSEYFFDGGCTNDSGLSNHYYLHSANNDEYSGTGASFDDVVTWYGSHLSALGWKQQPTIGITVKSASFTMDDKEFSIVDETPHQQSFVSPPAQPYHTLYGYGLRSDVASENHDCQP